MCINRIREISLGLQVSTLLTYMIGFTALKLSGSKKAGIPRHGKINTLGYTLGALSLSYVIFRIKAHNC